MPGWHEATKKLQESGAIQMVGIIEEQHPDRCKLFMQWKGMDWPILVDALNLLEVQAVPLTFLIDEHGTIVGRPRSPEALFEWAERPAPEGEPPGTHARTLLPTREDLRQQSKAAHEGGFEQRMAFGTDLYLWAGDNHAHHAVLAYEQAAEIKPDDPLLHFRLGVAYRKKFDLESRDHADFQQAIMHWQAGLDADPNQYIWRRRIQQYGPRLMKPYPFYDWVPQARKEIVARDEAPLALVVEPGGAEFARPEDEFSSAEADHENPDPEGKVLLDEKGFIDVKTVVVPNKVHPGDAVRVHMLMTPNEKVKAHWNNEVDDTVLWVDPDEDWEVDRRWINAKRPVAITSTEQRRVEFELKAPESADPGVVTVPSYVLYYVCEDVGGMCLFRRQDVEVRVNVVE